MADPKYMRKIQAMCRCEDCGLMAKTTEIDVEDDPYGQTKENR